MTRRTALAALGASALSGAALSQTIGGAPPGHLPASGPLLCCYSQNLAKVEYPELGIIAEQIGYDGVDLTVRPGGHVSPYVLNVDLVRAFESIRATGLELPMITTALTSGADPTAYPILAITGRTTVHLFRTGIWSGNGIADKAARLAQVRNDLQSLVFICQRCDMTAMIQNRAGAPFAASVAETESVIRDFDPGRLGYCFDPSQALAPDDPGAWEPALRLALPRLKAIALQDAIWTKSGGAPRLQPCPLGEGMVDWPRFFRILAEAKFTGPATIHLEYSAKDELSAMKKDLDFARRQIAESYRPKAGT